VPSLRAFRGLRFDASVAGDLARLVCPPYDVISTEVQQALLARDPHNAVRLELPADAPAEGAQDRYRRAARDLVTWRTEGVLRKDARPGIYVYEQTFTPPGSTSPRSQRGFFARLKLEPFEDGGVRRHEATLSGPKEDRLLLLRATGANTSAVMALYRTEDGRTRGLLDGLTTSSPEADVCDDEGVRHRLWYAPAGGDASGDAGTSADVVTNLLATVDERPLTIADGHHRYETALRYRDERNRACEADPPFDYVLVALFDVATEPLTILPTHRLVRSGPTGETLLGAAAELFDVRRLASGDELVDAMARDGTPSTHRFGVYSAGQAAMLSARPERIEQLFEPTTVPAVRALDVAVLSAALTRLLGLPTGRETGEHLAYMKDARGAISTVDAGGASSAFLLDPTPVESVVAVAESGEVMPQKSTYFYPKVITGLVLNPLEA
jgi:uncharacterized protein (DUF1015 family)